MNIYIPTIGRANRQLTADALRKAGVPFKLVVSEAELGGYAHPQVVCPLQGTNSIANVRQWILDQEGGKVCMMDDDILFYTREGEVKPCYFQKSTPEDVSKLATHLDELLDGYAHGGICEKFLSHNRPRHQDNRRYYRVLCYNKGLFPDPAPKFTVEIGEDHDMTLSLMLAGKPSFLCADYGHSSLKSKGGGCDLWRTKEIEERGWRQLVSKYPEIVGWECGKKVISWPMAAKMGGLR